MLWRKGPFELEQSTGCMGKITERELEHRQDWRLLSCCSRQEKEQICRIFSTAQVGVQKIKSAIRQIIEMTDGPTVWNRERR